MGSKMRIIYMRNKTFILIQILVMSTDLFFAGTFLYFIYIVINNPNIIPVVVMGFIVIMAAWHKHGFFLAWRKDNIKKFYLILGPPGTKIK